MAIIAWKVSAVVIHAILRISSHIIFHLVIVCCTTLSNMPRRLPKNRHSVPVIRSCATNYLIRVLRGTQMPYVTCSRPRSTYSTPTVTESQTAWPSTARRSLTHPCRVPTRSGPVYSSESWVYVPYFAAAGLPADKFEAWNTRTWKSRAP